MYKNRTINKSSSLFDALKKMDKLDKKLLIVFDENDKFEGLLSVGDIQRAIIKNKPLDSQVKKVLRSNIKVAHPEDSFSTIKNMMLEFRMELCPVINEQNEIVQVFFWEDIFGDELIKPKERFNLPVVIMAGGFGTRLRPITHIIPKPLLPIDNKTMLEHIFDRFHIYGSDTFYISVNYKASLIEFYLREQNLPYSITCFEEEKPLGTAGSLSLLKNHLKETFFVSNCDILIEQDYSEILNYHKKNNNELTIVAALKNYAIPYGTIDTGDNGQLLSLNEKPNLTFKINSGMYVLEPHLLDEIPHNKFFHITDLIEKIKKRAGTVGVFPVSEKSWKDVGKWDEYLRNIGY
ncbi:MAG: nucleotidyltransferase family protein [Candidatus Paceibacterota bacterium]